MIARILVMASIAGGLIAQENAAVPAGAALPKALERAVHEVVDRNARLMVPAQAVVCAVPLASMRGSEPERYTMLRVPAPTDVDRRMVAKAGVPECE